MKKTRTLAILLFILLPGLLLAAGKKETRLVIPADAKIIAGIKTQEVLNSSLGENLMDTIGSTALKQQGQGGNDSKADLNEELEKTMGLKLENLGNITLFFTEFDVKTDNTSMGIILEVIGISPVAVKDRIERKVALEAVQYREYTYYADPDKGSRMFLYAGNEEDIYIAASTGIMEAMLDIRKSGENITKNNEMNKLYNEYKENAIYLAGEMPDVSFINGMEVLQKVRKAGLGILMNDSLELNLSLSCDDEGAAKDINSLLGLYIGMASQLIPPEENAIREAAALLLDPIKLETDGNNLNINIVYTAAAINQIAKMIAGMVR